jgi:2-methylcitrate dehydratase PrpD
MAQDRERLVGLTLRFAEHVAKLRYEDLPVEVQDKAKLILRDGVGNQIAASAISEPARRMVELVASWQGAPQCTIVGYGLKAPAPHAALCNAMMGHGIELDDAHGTGLIKAGSVLVPSIFAAAELSKASGRDVIAALVGGYEIAIRVAKAINPGHRQRGYHTTGTVSTLGAAAAVARLLGCNAEAIAWAIGLAAMQSAGIQAYLDDACMAKPFSPGKAAFNGVLAAVMASRGFTGPRMALESKEGFFNAYTDEAGTEEFADDLGKRWAIMEVGFKPHAACRYAHGPIDLAQQAFHERRVRLADVESCTVGMSELAIRQASKPKAANLNAAMGSTEFSVALALAVGSNGLREYWDGFKNREIHEKAAHIRVRQEPAYGLTGRQADIAIALKGGNTVKLSSVEPKGEPTNPLSPEELERKFFAMTTMVVERAQAQRVAEMIMSLEKVSEASAVPRSTVIDAGPALRAA